MGEESEDKKEASETKAIVLEIQIKVCPGLRSCFRHCYPCMLRLATETLNRPCNSCGDQMTDAMGGFSMAPGTLAVPDECICYDNKDHDTDGGYGGDKDALTYSCRCFPRVLLWIPVGDSESSGLLSAVLEKSVSVCVCVCMHTLSLMSFFRSCPFFFFVRHGLLMACSSPLG